MSETTKKKMGRPPIEKNAGRKTSIFLTPAVEHLLLRFGSGNLSRGLRVACNAACSHFAGEDPELLRITQGWRKTMVMDVDTGESKQEEGAYYEE